MSFEQVAGAVVADCFYGDYDQLRGVLYRAGCGAGAQTAPQCLAVWRRGDTPADAAKAFPWNGPEDPGGWSKVAQVFRNGHAETWWATDATLGWWGPDRHARLVVATKDPQTRRKYRRGSAGSEVAQGALKGTVKGQASRKDNSVGVFASSDLDDRIERICLANDIVPQSAVEDSPKCTAPNWVLIGNNNSHQRLPVMDAQSELRQHISIYISPRWMALLTHHSSRLHPPNPHQWAADGIMAVRRSARLRRPGAHVKPGHTAKGHRLSV